jgi:hypothetical protein
MKAHQDAIVRRLRHPCCGALLSPPVLGEERKERVRFLFGMEIGAPV